MRRPDRCICGNALRLFGKRLPYFGGWERQLNAGATLLGLSNDQARELFVPAGRAKHSDLYTDPHDAAWYAILQPPTLLIGASLASCSTVNRALG
jgi:hypothetical protein